MKKVLITFFFFLGLHQTYGQSLTSEDLNTLILYLKADDWKSAFNESSKLLKSAEQDTSEFHAIILYANIYSAAGMVTKKQMTYDELKRNIMHFQGQKIIMPAQPVTTKSGSLNQVKFEVNDSTNKAFIAATNSKGINILCFENFAFQDKINPNDFPEKSLVRCGGTLEKIETNPNQSLIWILRLSIDNAFVRKMD